MHAVHLPSRHHGNTCVRQAELAVKNVELAAAAQEAEKLLKEITESTTIAEKEKAKVAVIVDQVSKTAAVRTSNSQKIRTVLRSV